MCDDMKSGLETSVGAMYIYPVVYTGISANIVIFDAVITVDVLHVCYILSPTSCHHTHATHHKLGNTGNIKTFIVSLPSRASLMNPSQTHDLVINHENPPRKEKRKMVLYVPEERIPGKQETRSVNPAAVTPKWENFSIAVVVARLP